MDILQRERLLKFGAVPFTTDVIAGELGDYSAVLAKIAALVDEGSLVRIKRGLYCLSPKISGHDLDSRVVANALYGPSYVSFETALSMYGLIPERVTATMSACVKRAKRFTTPLGEFSYRAVPGKTPEGFDDLVMCGDGEALTGLWFKHLKYYNLPVDRLHAIEDFLQKRASEILEFGDRSDDLLKIEAVSDSVNHVADGSLALQIKSNLRADPFMTYVELAELLQVSESSIARKMKALQASGEIRRVGADKNGHWEVVER